MMDYLFSMVSQFFAGLVPITDAIWDFPTNIEFYRQLPIIGQFSLPVILLIGMGIYFSFRTAFIQKESFGPAIKIMLNKQPSKVGVSAVGSFMLGLAMRAGPGNIVGITGAITIGGPGALFWMWVAAFFGMASAFIEAVLSQLFKERKNNEFVGGLPFYGRRILGNHRFVGVILSSIFIIYALFNIPNQTFYVFSAIGSISKAVTGVQYETTSAFYYIVAVILIISCASIIFGGIRRVVRYSDVLVPIKAVVFISMSLLIILINLPLLPYFFKEVIVGAFLPHAIFGGTIGVALAQGVKRGLMSNEAGQGTTSMAAAVANNKHPCEQGYIQSFSVFFDTMIICTMTGFIVVLAHIWTNHVDGAVWESMRASKLPFYLDSVKTLVPASIATIVEVIMSLCFGLFAFTTLLGMISFAEISANFISQSAKFIWMIRILGSLIFVPFGVSTILAGLQLDMLWSLSDLTNIIMVYANIPLLLLGLPFVLKALKHYRTDKTQPFYSEDHGFKTDCWNREYQKNR